MLKVTQFFETIIDVVGDFTVYFYRFVGVFEFSTEFVDSVRNIFCQL